MDTESVSRLTDAQVTSIAKAVLAHRPEDLIESGIGVGKVYFAATSRIGNIYGTWRLTLDAGDMLLQVVIRDTMYAERLPKNYPCRFDRIIAGLEQWVKAMNAEELKELIVNNPQLEHLGPEHIMNPSEYSPLGGARKWLA